MQMSMTILRGLYLTLCIALMSSLTFSLMPEESFLSCISVGCTLGVVTWVLCLVSERLAKRVSLKGCMALAFGLLLGQLLTMAFWQLLQTAVELQTAMIGEELIAVVHTLMYLAVSYFSVVLVGQSADSWDWQNWTVQPQAQKGVARRDLMIDGSVLLDSRIVEIAASGLLDGLLLMPQIVTKELYRMAESEDETVQSRGRRALEVLKKLESLPSLQMRYTDWDEPSLRTLTARLAALARAMGTNVLTADASRFLPYVSEEVRLVNIQMLSTAMKPISGDQLMVKVQRYGKEPRQGVGYLEDGTMVVINGGAEYLGEQVKAHVLSIKHTASGRMIFCNVDSEDDEIPLRQGVTEVEGARSYFTVQ